MLVYQWENQNIIDTYQKWYIMRLSLKTARNVWENFWYIKNDSKDWYYDILQYRTSLRDAQDRRRFDLPTNIAALYSDSLS